MSVQPIQPGLYRIRLPGVNAFLLDSDSDGLTLVDTGVPGSADRITDAVHSLGRDLTDIRQILVTHCHSDHSGSLAELKALTSARVFMHRNDGRLVVTGQVMRRLIPSPGSPQRSSVSSDHRAKANSRSSCDNRRAGRRWA